MTNENKNKRYYWIKLKDTFFTSDTVDFLMSQKNGANYVVLYQMLCLKSVNTQGELSRKIGEMIIPFDVDKIHRDCKYFDIDTIRVALELYIRLGLIYEQDNGILQIANFDNMVGSETQGAVEKRQQRYQKKLEESRGIDNGIDRVYQDNRDKILEIRDKRIDNRDKIEEEKVSYDTQKKKTKHNHKLYLCKIKHKDGRAEPQNRLFLCLDQPQPCSQTKQPGQGQDRRRSNRAMLKPQINECSLDLFFGWL